MQIRTRITSTSPLTVDKTVLVGKARHEIGTITLCEKEDIVRVQSIIHLPQYLGGGVRIYIKAYKYNENAERHPYSLLKEVKKTFLNKHYKEAIKAYYANKAKQVLE